MASLAPAYVPRRPTETVLHQLVRANLESFLAYARANYDGGLPRYVEQEFRAYIRCGDFSEGFSRAHCDACGHDLLVAFSCHGRSICPSCCGRRMANVAAHLVDRVLPDVPVRQYVLTLPYELRRLAAFKADVLTAFARIFVEAVFARYRSRAGCDGIESPQCGSVNFVQRFGSLNLHVHFHLLALDGVFARDARGRLVFHPAEAPTAADLEAIVARTARRSIAWLRKRGYIDDSPLEARSNEEPAETALDEVSDADLLDRVAIATPDLMAQVGRLGRVLGPRGLMPNPKTGTPSVERRLRAVGRERLARYGARPPLSLERLRRLPGGRVAYRLKYVDRGRRVKNRVMTGIEFMARLAAIIAPPRYPLVRFAGVLAGPTERRPEQHPAGDARGGPAPRAPSPPEASDTHRGPAMSAHDVAMVAAVRAAPLADDVMRLAPNIISVRHWDRLLGGLLYAVSPRVDWATLLRRSFSVDVLECPKCHGRLRMIAVITEREPARRILAHLGLPTDPLPVARARDPTDDADEAGDDGQLALGLA